MLDPQFILKQPQFFALLAYFEPLQHLIRPHAGLTHGTQPASQLMHQPRAWLRFQVKELLHELAATLWALQALKFDRHLNLPSSQVSPAWQAPTPRLALS
jgi:hypothetical protein